MALRPGGNLASFQVPLFRSALISSYAALYHWSPSGHAMASVRVFGSLLSPTLNTHSNASGTSKYELHSVSACKDSSEESFEDGSSSLDSTTGLCDVEGSFHHSWGGWRSLAG